MIYVTKDGETLDYICWKHYGNTRNMEKVLNVNRHIASMDAVLDAGIKVTLPAFEEPKTTQKIKLWQ